VRERVESRKEAVCVCATQKKTTYRKVNDIVRLIHGMIQTFGIVRMKEGRGLGKEAFE
jgi:hypothetical protein